MPAVIHAEKLTHINFAFAHIDAGGRVVFDNPDLAPAMKSLLALKQQNPKLKIIISVGGWEADGFSDAALTEASRATFAESALAFLRQHHADGIDLDWEYPGQGVAGIKFRAGGQGEFHAPAEAAARTLDTASAADGRNGPDRYTLTIASADREYFEHTEMSRLHVFLDWINVMSYDFFNSLTPTTGHHAGLFASAFAAPTDRNADASVRQHIAAGIPAGKLVLGVAFYGRGFAGVKPAHEGLNQPYASSMAPPVTRNWSRSGSATRVSSATGTSARRRLTSGTKRRRPSLPMTTRSPSARKQTMCGPRVSAA